MAFKIAQVLGEQTCLVVDNLYNLVSTHETRELAYKAIERIKKEKLDFHAIYKDYPRKIGKKSGIKWLQTHIKTHQKYKQLQTALKNYIEHVEGWDEKYIKHFNVWVKKWDDWLECGDDRPQPNKNSSRSIEEILSGKSLELF